MSNKIAKITTSELSTLLMSVPSITMTLLYIRMGIDDNSPQAPSGYFLPTPGGRGIYKKRLEPT
jgi:hypothetical protein